VLPLILLGPFAVARVETLGLHRNVLITLVTTALPRIAAEKATDRPWTHLARGTMAQQNLSHYRHAASDRNVVVVILESAAAQYLRPYGAAEDPMPNLTALAQQGMLFENMYAVYPESIKGLIAILCSNYPAFDTKPEHYETNTSPSLAAILRQRNYHTALFHSGRFQYLGMTSIIRNRGYQVLEDAGHIGGDHNSSFGIDEPSTVRRMLAWIDSLPSGERFFITYMPIAGHHPYATPKRGPFPDDRLIDRYRNALHYADAALEALFSGLQARRLDRETLFVVLGDHGQAFGQHPGNYGHNLFLYEENVRIPFVVVAPEMILESLRLQRIASQIDLAPTILDFLGLPVPESYQGQSLLRNQPREALFFTDYSLGMLGLRDGKWKFIFEIEGSNTRLFNLRDDPAEQHNMAKQFPERVAKYREHLHRWSAAQRYRVTNGS
jgi:phosphoglycerol transferase MdoB-like AlkP superfamily enzyme